MGGCLGAAGGGALAGWLVASPWRVGILTDRRGCAGCKSRVTLHYMQQTTPAQLRAAAEAKLQPLGQRRIHVLAELDEIDRALKPLILEARAVEVSLRRISELTAIAPNTLRAWTRPRPA